MRRTGEKDAQNDGNSDDEHSNNSRHQSDRCPRHAVPVIFQDAYAGIFAAAAMPLVVQGVWKGWLVSWSVLVFVRKPKVLTIHFVAFRLVSVGKHGVCRVEIINFFDY